MIIAIDGPSGSGKSSIAKQVAKILDIEHLDTGAMYRLFALKMKKENKEVEELLNDLDIRIEKETFYLDGINVSNEIRENEISKLASKLSKIDKVREYMVNMQREISKNKDIVLDGRDIGTVVFPNADFKFFITASPEIRAKRRYLENTSIDYEIILKDIIKRDEQDMNREIAPLKQAENSILIDTDNLTLDEVVNKIIKIVQEKKI
ncbi:(d)CMP kinase [Oceanivirga salmonicida]|uniref:(d)CMP kinase n=1 Tax=Oceanivirga salmonicida TaxID=1769291 RepID=UPI0012E17CC7|nr:(d)CMP kinase [Oceanivirga salmonicida]